MKNTSSLLTFLALTLILNAIIVNVAHSSPVTKIYVDNPAKAGIQSAFSAQPGEKFNLTINIADVFDLFAWEARISWNKTILDATLVTEGPFLKKQPEGTMFVPVINQTEGYVDLGCTTMGEYYGVSGSGTLVSITFLVQELGATDLTVELTTLLEHLLNYIPHTTSGGSFSNIGEPDIAVTDITINPTTVQAGDLVSINVTVANQWVSTETFNVTLSYSWDTHKTIIDSRTDITLDGMTNTILEFTWNTTGLLGGNYMIVAEANFLESEADTDDNTRTAGPVHIPMHDVAVTDVTANPTKVSPGQTVTISVAIKNKGDFPETFKVKLYSDSTSLTEWTITNLAPGATQTLTYSWDTTNVEPSSYQIKAVADSLPEERDTNDNTFITPWDRAVEITSSSQTPFPIEFVAAAIGVAIVAIVIVVFIVRRRSRGKPS